MPTAVYRMARWAYQPIKQARRLAVEIKATISRRPIIEKYLAASGFKGLQIGSGPHLRPGWLNSDLPGTPGVEIGLDITKQLPFPENSLHAIYGSEVIEHIPKDAVPGFLKEAVRVLQKDGVLRLTTPDLVQLCRIALGISTECTLEQLATTWLEDKHLTRDKRLTRDIWMNVMFRSWGHQHIWDYESLKDQLIHAGFREVTFVPPQETTSKFQQLANQETRYGVPPPPFVWAGSLIIEATK